MNRPAIILHWTDQPERAAISEVCRLLDLGLSPLLFSPPDLSANLREILNQPADSDVAALKAWNRWERAAFLCEGPIPYVRTPNDVTRHILMPWIGTDYAGHAIFLRQIPRTPPAVRLHLFIDPEQNIESGLRALIPSSQGIPAAPDTLPLGDVKHRLHWSALRYQEFRSAVTRDERCRRRTQPALSHGVRCAHYAGAQREVNVYAGLSTCAGTQGAVWRGGWRKSELSFPAKRQSPCQVRSKRSSTKLGKESNGKKTSSHGQLLQ
ncbi:MAG: hypothetical protein QOE70_727 [Chthoniobacter sp.]|nr:hypothetical protein [Chthoniobacter sp.]